MDHIIISAYKREFIQLFRGMVFRVIPWGPIEIDTNIDGVPLFKSSGGQFWPILVRLASPFVSDPFPVGIFYGDSQPSSLDFLDEFVSEYKVLQQNGIIVNNTRLDFGIRAFVCDAPARAFIKNIKGHAACLTEPLEDSNVSL